MFVYVIGLLILLFFQITSESDKNANHNDKAGLETYFQEREKNQDNNHYLESSKETISREEDPEFPLYLDSQVLLDNQDAEISPQIRGIKRYVNTEKMFNFIRYHNPTENKNKQQSSVGNKPIGSTAYYKMRRKRNLIGKNKFKNHTKKRPLRSSRENEDEEEGWKTQKQFDLCAYRPNDECFQSEQKRTKTRLSTPEPTVLADDYFQDEMQTLSQNHNVTNNTLKSYSISASITNMTRASKDITKPQIAPTHPKNKNITVNFSVTQVSFGNTTASTPTKKGTTEDMCKQVLYTFVRGGSLSTIDNRSLYSSKITNSSSSFNAIIEQSKGLKSDTIKKVEDGPSVSYTDPALEGFSSGTKGVKSTLPATLTSKLTLSSPTYNLHLTTSINNSQNMSGILYNTSDLVSLSKVVNKTDYKHSYLSNLPNNTTTLKEISKQTLFTVNDKSTSPLPYKTSSTHINVFTNKPVIIQYNLSAFEDSDNLISFQADQSFKLETSSEKIESGNSSECFKIYCQEVLPSSSSMENSSESKNINDFTPTERNNKLEKSGNVNVAYCGKDKSNTYPSQLQKHLVAGKGNGYKILHQIDKPLNVTKESIYYAYHNKTTPSRRAYTFFFVSEHQTTNTPETKLSAFFKKLTNNSIIQNKSSTKSSIITLHHKEPCKEVEVTVKPIVERVLSIIPKPTDKIPSEHYNQSVTLRHKKVYPINHKGNHYYHGKHPLRVSKTTVKCITTPGEPSIGQSMPKHQGNNEKLVSEPIITSEKYKSNTNSEHTIVTTSPGKFTQTTKENKSFITKRKVGKALGNKESSVEMLNGSTFSPSDNKCAVLHVTNDIKEILPQKFHKEYLSRQPIEPMKVFHGVSKIKNKPKTRDKLYLCSSNKTIFNN